MEGIFTPNGMLIQGFILATGIIGQVYVSHMNVRGFYYWAASNVALIAVALHFGGYGMVGLYSYFLFLAIYSLHHWGKRQEEERAGKERHAELLAIASVFVELANTPEITNDSPSEYRELRLRVASAKAILQAESYVTTSTSKPVKDIDKDEIYDCPLHGNPGESYCPRC